jgi:hypothetical protein
LLLLNQQLKVSGSFNASLTDSNPSFKHDEAHKVANSYTDHTLVGFMFSLYFLVLLSTSQTGHVLVNALGLHDDINCDRTITK